MSHVFRDFVCEVIAALVFSRKRVTEDGLTRLFASVFAEPVESVKLFQSANVDRAPQAMYYTQAGLIIKHNKQIKIVPLANVLAVDIERSANYQRPGGMNAAVSNR